MDRRLENLHRALHPRAVAVVGARRLDDYMWLRNLSTFAGPVYSVNIDEKEIPGIEALGFQNYKRLTDIPGPVDFAVVAVPRRATPLVLQDAIAKGVAGVALFTAGFAETGEAEGRQLQETLAAMARDAGIALIGPNCMGLYHPKVGLRNHVEQPAGEAGNVGFLSQSGTHAINFSLYGASQGLKCSKVISYGNGVVLDSPDYLEYLLQDDETTVIGMYIEGVRDGRRFFEVAKRIPPRKPLLIWRGGQTEAGRRATASHTASLAQSNEVWGALLRQTGAIGVDGLEEMVDTIKALQFLKPTPGTRLGLVTMTGGPSVVITDTFAREGLEIPPLSEASYARFRTFFNIIGGSYQNPIDMGMNWAGENFEEILRVLRDDPHVDAVVVDLPLTFLLRRMALRPDFKARLFSCLTEMRQHDDKPLLAVVGFSPFEKEEVDFRRELLALGVPAFHNFARAARAFRHVSAYARFRARLAQEGG
ncbi:MAG: CoA-binding protein [Candidatus Tectimicrobiota bacterium]|nr:MAG: CoA-binding protein [Candidatus Tectomicrobia bacterium]